jgi:hypothetical protein
MTIITAFARVGIVSYPEPDESNPYPQTLPLRAILILSSYLRSGILNNLIPSGFPTKAEYAFPISPMPCCSPEHRILKHAQPLFF